MSHYFSYLPPRGLRNGLSMTLYTALYVSRRWEKFIFEPEPTYRSHLFKGAEDVPIFGQYAIPEAPKGTIIATYGITGSLEDQWFLRLLGRKAVAQNYAIVMFDWRAHGKTAELSPTLTSDGLYEGEDFVQIAMQAKALGCPAPFWFTGYSLGGQLALWGAKAAQEFQVSEIAGAAVICPSLDSNRSLVYLENHPLGRHLEQAIARSLKKLAQQLYTYHPNEFDLAAIERANSIRAFDHELVIGRLGFSSVEQYYDVSSPLRHLPQIQNPLMILYAADDPLFDPSIVMDLESHCAGNSAIDLVLTAYGGHVGYFSSKACQRQFNDPDPWWAWNRVLEWIELKGRENGTAVS